MGYDLNKALESQENARKYYGGDKSAQTWTAPQSWVDYAQQNAPDNGGEVKFRGGNLEGVLSFGKGIAKTFAAASDIGNKIMSPFEALGQTLAGKDPIKNIGTSSFGSRYKENLTETTANKTSFEKLTGTDLKDKDAQRDFIASAVELPLWAYGGGSGIKSLTAANSSLAAKVLGNSALGAQVGGLTGAVETFREDGGVKDYIGGTIGGAFGGALVGGVATGVLGGIFGKIKNAGVKAELSKIGVARDKLGKLTNLEAQRILTSNNPKKELSAILKEQKLKSMPATKVQAARDELSSVLEKYKKEVLPKYKAETQIGRANQGKKYDQARENAINAGATPDEANKIAAKKAGGKFERTTNLDALGFSQESKNILLSDMHYKLTTFENMNAAESFDMLLSGKPITTSQIKILEKGLGMDLKEYLSSEGYGKFWSFLSEVGGGMRALKSTGDLSVTLRQNFTALSRGLMTHPVETLKLFGKDLRYWGVGGGEKTFQESFMALKKSPNYRSAVDSGVVFNEIDDTLAAKGEEFASTKINKVPVVGNITRAAERHYTGYGNDVRMSRWNDFTQRMAVNKVTPSSHPEIFKAYAELVNASTGIGKLPKAVANMRVQLNAAFFSPRLMFSRFKYLNPSTYLSGDIPIQVRKEYAKDLASMMGIVLSTWGVTKLAGGEMETNPLSSDFGKAKFGNTRIEMFGGYSPYIRNLAQFVMNKSKSTYTGEIGSLDKFGSSGRGGTASKFARSKLSPLAGTIVDLTTGKDFLGNPTTAYSVTKNALVPMLPMDLWETMKEEDRNMFSLLIFGTLGTLGAGMNTYGSPKKQREQDTRNLEVKQAKEQGGLEEIKYRLTHK